MRGCVKQITTFYCFLVQKNKAHYKTVFNPFAMRTITIILLFYEFILNILFPYLHHHKSLFPLHQRNLYFYHIIYSFALNAALITPVLMILLYIPDRYQKNSTNLLLIASIIGAYLSVQSISL